MKRSRPSSDFFACLKSFLIRHSLNSVAAVYSLQLLLILNEVEFLIKLEFRCLVLCVCVFVFVRYPLVRT